MAKQVILLLLLLPCMALAAPYGGMYPDAISSADIPDPLVPLDGCQGITGDLTASGTVTGGTITDGTAVMSGGVITAGSSVMQNGIAYSPVLKCDAMEPLATTADLIFDIRNNAYSLIFRDASNVEQFSVSATGIITGSALLIGASSAPAWTSSTPSGAHWMTNGSAPSPQANNKMYIYDGTTWTASW